MNDTEFALNAADYGLPTRRQFQEMRIWDSHYHGFLSDEGGYTAGHERMTHYINRMGVERVFALDIGGDSAKDDQMEVIPERDAAQRRLLEEEKDFLSGIIRIDPTVPEKSCAKIERWIRNGPCVGIKYVGGNRSGLPCSHPNNDSFIRLAAELNAIIYIHTWLKVGGTPRRWGGGNLPGENTPMDVVDLHKRFPDLKLICGHSGGDWEIGVQVVRPYPNIYFEFTGSDSHSGQIDYAVKHLGADRITWGGHGPSRSYANELSKVLDADLTREQRRLILGENYRRLAEKIFRNKGYSMASRWGVA